MTEIAFGIKEGLSVFMVDWFNDLWPDTDQLTEFTGRPSKNAIMWAPERMVDSVEDMLAAYERNVNSSTPNAGSLLPVVFIAMGKDNLPTAGEWGGRQVWSQWVRLVDDMCGSVYKYRQAAADIRVQFAIVASESPTARSLSNQLLNWLGTFKNRRFHWDYQWGQYTIKIPCMIETPDVPFQEVKTERKNITILVCDINLKAVIPYLRAPKVGEPNDGTTNEPPGYPVVTGISVTDVSNGYHKELTSVCSLQSLMYDGSVPHDGSQIYDGHKR